MVIDMYFYEEYFDRNNHDLIGNYPLSTFISFNRQFSLDPTKYIDQNTFLRENSLISYESRFNFFNKPVTYNFIQSSFSTSFTMDEPLTFERKISRNGGKTYKMENTTLISGSYFYLSNRRVEHIRLVYTYANLISDIGGFSLTILKLIGLVCTKLTYLHLANRFI